MRDPISLWVVGLDGHYDYVDRIALNGNFPLALK